MIVGDAGQPPKHQWLFCYLVAEVGTEALEDEARRRAMNGSDTLLIFFC